MITPVTLIVTGFNVMLFAALTVIMAILKRPIYAASDAAVCAFFLLLFIYMVVKL